MNQMADTPKPSPSAEARDARLDMAVRRNAVVRRIRLADQDHFERTRLSELIKPTAETEKRLRPDVIDTLHRAGTISVEQRAFAGLIQEVYTAVCGAMFAKVSNYEGLSGRSGSGMAERIARLHHDHYLPWADYIGGRKAAPPIVERDILGVPTGRIRPGQTAKMAHFVLGIDFAISVVLDGASLRECASRYRWGHDNFATEALIYVLAAGCWLSGWDDRSNGKIVAAFEDKYQKKLRRMR